MIYKTSNAYSFGHAEKNTGTNLINKEILKTPGIYKYQKEILIKPSGGLKFSKEEKLKQLRPKTPGPGDYNTQKICFGETGPKYSINKSNKETQIDKMVNKSKKNNAPGPGDYKISEETYYKTKYKNSNVGHFGKSPKLKNNDNKYPGVGKYNINSSDDFGKSTKNKFTIGKANRKDIVDFSKTSSSFKHKNDIKALDPGYYQVSNNTFGKEGQKILLRGKPKDEKKFNTPGPGDYNEDKAKNYTMKKNPSIGFGYGKKTDITEIAKKKNVPSCNYAPPGFDVSNKSKIGGHTFDKSERMPKQKSNGLGPGSYHIPCSFANTPDYSKIDNKFAKI